MVNLANLARDGGPRPRPPFKPLAGRPLRIGCVSADVRQDTVGLFAKDVLQAHDATRVCVVVYSAGSVKDWVTQAIAASCQLRDVAALDDAALANLIRLPQRLCYTPVPWMPATTPPAPVLRQGHITFGSFNNTAKLNPGVVVLWARMLAGVPGSRLVLKWRTFNDGHFRQAVLAALAGHGIAPERIELRGPSFHADVLKEYADIDIALDPFPFTGGLASCEALYMGVPVVTWPQCRVVSRQTLAFLSAIGLPELAAQDANDCVRIAIELAHDTERLQTLHATLRQRMNDSPLCNAPAFTHQLENALIDLHRRIEREEQDPTTHAKTILHVGPGGL